MVQILRSTNKKHCASAQGQLQNKLTLQSVLAGNQPVPLASGLLMASAYFSFGPDSIQGKLGITEGSREANLSVMLGRIFTWSAPLQAR